MAKKMTGLDKLEKLGRFIRAGKFAEGNEFHMGTWYEKHHCGTVACMGGYATAMFPRDLRLVRDPYGSTIESCTRNPDGYNSDGYDALAETFGITEDESVSLFRPDASRSTDHAYHGQRVLDFVARKRAETA
jgi:hypothetical protein